MKYLRIDLKEDDHIKVWIDGADLHVVVFGFKRRKADGGPSVIRRQRPAFFPLADPDCFEQAKARIASIIEERG